MYMSRDPLSDDQRSRFAKFGVVPNRSVSSLDLEEPRMVRVRLSVDYRVHSRQMLCVGGSAIPLGWSFLSIAKVPMSWEPQDRWVVEFELAAGSKLEYKYVILEEQDWTQQMNAATEGMVEYEYRVQPEVNPPDVQRITRRMAIVAWQSGGNRVLVMPSEEEIDQVTGNGGGWRAFEGKVGGAGATWTVGADGAERDASSSLSREHLHIDETTGLPVLDRLDAWGDDGISPYR